MYKIGPPYIDLDVGNQSSCMITDHIGGFDSSLQCKVLDVLNERNDNFILYTEYILTDAVKMAYPNLDIRFHIDLWKNLNYADSFDAYKIHPELTFQNFLCSFNGAPHVGRKLLVAILQKLKFFNPKTCSKNFSYAVDVLDGHLADFLEEQQFRIYKKYFISDDSKTFFDNIYSFGHVRYDHKNNIYNLEDKITRSFLHVVSETMATSYYPFVTEKFLYSVVTRGLFLAYAQPGWHDHLERYYGFKKYDRIFDYRFDAIQNPVERLVELMSMIAKFSVLNKDDWRDLYEIEIDTVEYNYDHYFGKHYIKHLEHLTDTI